MKETDGSYKLKKGYCWGNLGDILYSPFILRLQSSIDLTRRANARLRVALPCFVSHDYATKLTKWSCSPDLTLKLSGYFSSNSANVLHS